MAVCPALQLLQTTKRLIRPDVEPNHPGLGGSPQVLRPPTVSPDTNRVQAEVFEPHLMLAAALGVTEAPRRLETRR